ncbi:MAG: hypothetical protein PUJ11_00745 [Eubacteriaceae bacterium]|nr:hypothetical protein [Eubacteriaceae bacterium]
MVYKGIQRERDPWFKYVALAAAGFMFYYSVKGGFITYAALAVVVVLAAFLKKEHIVSEEGVDIKYTLFGMTHVNRWEWSEITAIQADFKKKYPDVLLHICKDVSIRGFVFKPYEIEGIRELASRMNPNL